MSNPRALIEFKPDFYGNGTYIHCNYCGNFIVKDNIEDKLDMVLHFLSEHAPIDTSPPLPRS